MIEPRRIGHLQAALDRSGGKRSVSYVLGQVLDQKAQLWEAPDATVVTQIGDDGTFNIWLAGGRFDDVVGLLEEAEEWARGQGCTRIEVTGRKGWARSLEPYGFRQDAVVLSKDL